MVGVGIKMYELVEEKIFFKIPPYEELLKDRKCPCFCHDHGKLFYQDRFDKECRNCPCFFFTTFNKG